MLKNVFLYFIVRYIIYMVSSLDPYFRDSLHALFCKVSRATGAMNLTVRQHQLQTNHIQRWNCPVATAEATMFQLGFGSSRQHGFYHIGGSRLNLRVNLLELFFLVLFRSQWSHHFSLDSKSTLHLRLRPKRFRKSWKTSVHSSLTSKGVQGVSGSTSRTRSASNEGIDVMPWSIFGKTSVAVAILKQA